LLKLQLVFGIFLIDKNIYFILYIFFILNNTLMLEFEHDKKDFDICFVIL